MQAATRLLQYTLHLIVLATLWCGSPAHATYAPTLPEPLVSEETRESVMKEESDKRLRKARADLSKPSLLLSELILRASSNRRPQRFQEAVPFIEEFMRIYPTGSDDDKYVYGAQAIWEALNYSDTRLSEVATTNTDNSPTYIEPVRLYESNREKPLDELSVRLIRQALNAQTESWELNEWATSILKDLLQRPKLESSIRQQASDLLKKQLPKPVSAFKRTLHELEEITNTANGPTPFDNEASESSRNSAASRARSIIRKLEIAYPRLSDREKHQFAASLLRCTGYLIYAARVPQAEPLFWIVEESVNPVWFDTGSIASCLDFGLFCQRNERLKEIKVLKKLIALEQSRSTFSLAEHYMWLGDAYNAIEQRADAEKSWLSALPLYEECRTSSLRMGDQKNDYVPKQIKRIHSLLPAIDPGARK